MPLSDGLGLCSIMPLSDGLGLCSIMPLSDGDGGAIGLAEGGALAPGCVHAASRALAPSAITATKGARRSVRLGISTSTSRGEADRFAVGRDVPVTVP